MPKPLLPLAGWPMFLRALACYPTIPTLLVTTEAVAESKHFQLITAGYQVVVLEQPTHGPLETILAHPTGRAWVSTLEELLIGDCDSLFDQQELMQALRHFRIQSADGGVTIRQTTDQGCSYVQLTTGGWVTQSAEKQVLSDQSSTGPYWFKHGQLFVNAAASAMRDGHYSVNPTYNYLRAQGLNIQTYPWTSFRHLGTPADYEAYRSP